MTEALRTRARGRLRVLLGAAPGVGKTYAMLNEGQRRKARGTDVVVAVVETHGRPQTAAQLAGLEQVPLREIEYRGAKFKEMDVEAVLRRDPEVALVDELAHTNVQGSLHERRADDVETLLAAGIDVITTVNVQHLESLNDVVAQITGITQRETVPDVTVRSADQIELVDMDPDALRRRIAHGNVYALEKVESALKNYFRPGNLAALRELALLWVADRVDEGLFRYRDSNSIADTWQTRDRVVVALSGGPEGAMLLRRGARIAHKGAGGDLLAVYVARQDGLVHSDRRALAEQRRLVEDLDGTFLTLAGDDPAEVILEYARKMNATSIVIGNTRASRWQRLFRTPVDRQIIAGAGDIDVHVVTHQWASGGGHRGAPRLSRRRRALGLGLALALPVALTCGLSTWHQANEALSTMLFLAVTVVVALVGGIIPALASAFEGGALLNWFFTPPIGTFTIADPKSVISLVVSVLLGVAVAGVVDQAVVRARAAAHARSEADTLFLLTEQTLAADLTVESALDVVRETFRQLGAALQRRSSVMSPWENVGTSGECDGTPASVVRIDEHVQIACWGEPLRASDERVLTAFGHQFQARLERDSLRAQARQVAELEARDGLQTALLAAVSHDLRTPLAAIKAASSSLLDPEVELPAQYRLELVQMVDDNAERLERLIANLLDMTRLRTGHLSVVLEPMSPTELAAIMRRDHPSLEVRLDPGAQLIRTDQGLVERILGNLVDNAARHQPEGSAVVLDVQSEPDEVVFRIIDRGPGVPAARREQIFKPFQQLGDKGTGVGLGLAVAQGFAHAIGANIVARDTPGGGLTMELRLPTEHEHNGDHDRK